jgi:hypothetical protein
MTAVSGRVLTCDLSTSSELGDASALETPQCARPGTDILAFISASHAAPSSAVALPSLLTHPQRHTQRETHTRTQTTHRDANRHTHRVSTYVVLSGYVQLTHVLELG